ncbi:hypothetical protein SAMN02745724_02382 [Pseudoalteromonas denitrificans DSM 6059]|uniref:Uncharacterized protein n=1 Tax=Pseudoalteromonas denitrificans DSM 6059 TaxID=1123010 RepID=A0A1I1LH63_9GAMM|nr:hypothetical protein SAMN02745724_02382 [Pseudoalteromonas denitrificans DSM 6059]
MTLRLRLSDSFVLVKFQFYDLKAELINLLITTYSMLQQKGDTYFLSDNLNK